MGGFGRPERSGWETGLGCLEEAGRVLGGLRLGGLRLLGYCGCVVYEGASLECLVCVRVWTLEARL